MKSITFLMPPFVYSPVGGFKIVLEYANRLAKDGYEVHIVYADSIKYVKVPWKLMLKLQLKALLFKIGLLKRSIKIWFPIDNRIREHNVYSLAYSEVPKTDVYVCTAVNTAKWLKSYPIDAVKKRYFIQDYEVWGRTEQEVRVTYRYDMKKIVIAKWLLDIVLEESDDCCLVPNGFNNEEFYITKPIVEKDKYCVLMLYHWSERKGCKTSFAALNLVKQRFPQLRVILFGTPDCPPNLPDWYKYYQSPSKKEHLRINNEGAIYVAASIEEGWGLTIGEAMMCGQAVACTDVAGFKEMAKNNENALLSPVGDVQALASNIIRLIEEDEFRFKIAQCGFKSIQNMSIDKTYELFKNAVLD